MANIFGRQVVVPLTNKSGGSVIAGDVVIIDTTNNDAFTTTTSSGATATIGVVQEAIANNATGRVLTAGYAALVNVNASVTRGNYGKTHTVAKQATDAGASRVAGTFCQFLTGGTTPDAMVYPVDLAGAALTNPMTTAGDIIYGGASGVPTRLAAGTAAQALMGGTTPFWGGPTFSDWTPVLTADGGDPALGSTGTASGRYFQFGKFVFAWGKLQFGGSGISAGSGVYEFTFPVAAINANQSVMGIAQLYDDSAGLFTIGAVYTLDTGEFRISLPSTALLVQNNQPWTWANNDQIQFELRYEAA